MEPVHAVNREDIYDHLAQVYLGKRNKAEAQRKKQFSVWLVINVVITLIIFVSAFYGLTAFLAQRRAYLKESVIFSLHNGPIRLQYNFKDSLAPVKAFALDVPSMVETAKYKNINFSIRGKEEGAPGIVKVVFRNRKNESASHYVRGVDLTWQKISIPLEEFSGITDWQSLMDVTFVLESWNVDSLKGEVLIDDVRLGS